MAAVLDDDVSVATLLGGQSVLHVQPQTAGDWISLVREGLPSKSLDAFLEQLDMTRSQLAQALGIPERTLARRKREGQLSSEESAKLIRLARVIQRAIEVFEDADAALAWMMIPNAALSGETPFSLMDTEFGAEDVLATLGRIEHGVFA